MGLVKSSWFFQDARQTLMLCGDNFLFNAVSTYCVCQIIFYKYFSNRNSWIFESELFRSRHATSFNISSWELSIIFRYSWNRPFFCVTSGGGIWFRKGNQYVGVVRIIPQTICIDSCKWVSILFVYRLLSILGPILCCWTNQLNADTCSASIANPN